MRSACPAGQLAACIDAQVQGVPECRLCAAFVMDADKDWLNERIARRFDLMLEQGALEEAEANLTGWDPALPSSKAIGAPELIAYLRGENTLEEARELATISTRQYAKRQRTWFRSRMKNWQKISLPAK